MDSYVCKIVILRPDENRILKPKMTGNVVNKPVRLGGIKRCLFGVAKPEETEKMLEEQFEIDRKRFNKRFGIDIRKIEEIETEGNTENIVRNCTVHNATQVKKNSVIGRKVVKSSREVFRQQNSQTVLTDFYQARKSVQSLDKSTDDTKEN